MSKEQTSRGEPKELNPMLMGSRIHYLRRVSSTNDVASELAYQGAPEGTVVVAEAQDEGRGRLRRRWFSPPGGLWISVILRPRGGPIDALRITLTAGLSVVEVLRDLYDLKATIKWPNDVRVKSRKICGVLSEMDSIEDQMDHVVLGFGLNANVNEFPEELGEEATSLIRELGKKVSLFELSKELLKGLEKWYLVLQRDGFEPILKEWVKHSDTLGRRVRFKDQEGLREGEAFGVDLDGSLLVKIEGETRKIFISDYIYVD